MRKLKRLASQTDLRMAALAPAVSVLAWHLLSVDCWLGAVVIIAYLSGRIYYIGHHSQGRTDPLTGLLSRDAIVAHMSRALRGDGKGAVLFVDLDRFKQINDTMGHQVGDSVLVTAAKRILGCLRDDDLVGRIGGDEFVIFLGDCDDAEIVSRKISAVVTAPFRAGDRMLGISASIGIATAPEHGTTALELVERADVAMYQSKHAGGDTTTIYRPGMTTNGSVAADTRLAWLHETV